MVKNLSTKLKLLVLVFVSIIALIIVGIIGLTKLSEVNKGLETVYQDRVIPLEQLKIIADEYAINIVDTTHQTRNGNFNFETCISNITVAEDKIHKQWEAYSSTFLTEKEKKLVQKSLTSEHRITLDSNTLALNI